MSRFHDPDAADCRCFHCSEARYHEAATAAQAEAELAAHHADAEAELAGRQLRFSWASSSAAVGPTKRRASPTSPTTASTL